MRSIDPSRMSPAEIRAELAGLLAAGFQRHIASSMRRSEEGSNQSNPLAESSASEASCGRPTETSS